MRKISDILRQSREKKKLELSFVEQETKIKKEFLEAIENGEFDKLPSESYVTGFVKNYIKFLELPLNESMALFRREYESKHKVTILPEFRKSQNRYNKKFLLSSKGLLVAAIGIIVGVYIFIQYSSLIFAPPIEILKPKNGATITGNVIEVSGKTDPYATVTVDGEEAYVNLKGEFKKSVYGFTGENKIEIVAKNRFGKEAKTTITVNSK